MNTHKLTDIEKLILNEILFVSDCVLPNTQETQSIIPVLKTLRQQIKNKSQCYVSDIQPYSNFLIPLFEEYLRRQIFSRNDLSSMPFDYIERRDFELSIRSANALLQYLK